MNGHRRKRVNIAGVMVLVVCAGLWELVVRTGLVSFSYIPPPSKVVVGLWAITRSGTLFTNAGHTLASALIGWVVAAAVGIGIGVVVGVWWQAWRFTGASLETLRALPAVAFVPLAMIIFGFNVKVEIAVAAYGALWPVMLNTAAGMRSTEVNLDDVARVMQLSPLVTIWKVRLPAAVPSIVIGLRLGMAFSLVLTLVTEMIGNPAGIGNQMVFEAQALQPARMFAYLMVIGILGVVLNAILIGAARLLMPGPMALARETD